MKQNENRGGDTITSKALLGYFMLIKYKFQDGDTTSTNLHFSWLALTYRNTTDKRKVNPLFSFVERQGKKQYTLTWRIKPPPRGARGLKGVLRGSDFPASSPGPGRGCEVGTHFCIKG